MQTKQLADFGNKVTLLLPDLAKRRIVLPTIVGMAIGNFLQVKVGSEDMPMQVYNENCAAIVSRAASRINEEVIIDVQTTIDAARSQYLMRSRILNADCVDYTINPEFDFMATALGLATIMPVEVYAALKEVGLSAAKLYQLANLLIKKLKEDEVITL